MSFQIGRGLGTEVFRGAFPLAGQTIVTQAFMYLTLVQEPERQKPRKIGAFGVLASSCDGLLGVQAVGAGFEPAVT